jgi:ribonuclease R
METGTLRAHARGFGFVETGGTSVFVPPPRMRGMLDGDVVSVRVGARDDAETIELLERGRRIVVADVTSSEGGRCKARVDRCIGDVELVLDRAVRGAVVCELVGEPGATMRARVVEELGDAKRDSAVVRRVMERYELPVGHADESTQAAERVASTPAATRATRRDLREQLVVTIDADTSKDLDDALAAEVGPDGSLRVFVHIADVAERLVPGSVLDQAAASVPTSVYLPQHVRHMLPEALSAQALSLLPGVERGAMTVEMRIDAAGCVRSVDVYESQIRSRQRLSYETVAKVMAGATVDAHGEELDDDVLGLVAMLHAAAARLSVQRAARGGVDSARGDDSGESDEDPAHELVERLMVAANEAVAGWLEERGMPVVYRAHEGLDDEAAEKLEAEVRALGMHAALPRPVSPQAFAALARAAIGERAAAFWDAAMGVMPRAKYQLEACGHFGLGANRYSHFTSPIRRYADVLVHRVIKAYLAGERNVDAGAVAAHMDRINDTTRRAAWAERDATRIKALLGMRVGQVVEATVGSQGPKSARVQLEDGTIAMLDGTWERGQVVTLEVTKLEPLEGKLELRVKRQGR